MKRNISGNEWRNRKINESRLKAAKENAASSRKRK
jgi:hypothetical protein